MIKVFKKEKLKLIYLHIYSKDYFILCFVVYRQFYRRFRLRSCRKTFSLAQESEINRMYTHRMAVSHVRSMSFLVEIVTVTRKNIDEPRNLMVCDFTMSIYKNRLPSRSIELNYATWRDEYTQRFFHGGNDTARQFIKFHTRSWQGVSSTDTAVPVDRACKSVEDYARNTHATFFTGRKLRLASAVLSVRPKIIFSLGRMAWKVRMESNLSYLSHG